MTVVNSGVAEPKFSKFLHDVARSSPFNLLKLELQYSNPFGNAKVTNEG